MVYVPEHATGPSNAPTALAGRSRCFATVEGRIVVGSKTGFRPGEPRDHPCTLGRWPAGPMSEPRGRREDNAIVCDLDGERLVTGSSINLVAVGEGTRADLELLVTPWARPGHRRSNRQGSA